MKAQRIYLDNAATTPLDPRVGQAAAPFWNGTVGNPSSLHREGREAHQAIERARGEVAALLHAQPREIVFTSGGTESNNLAIRGLIGSFSSHPWHVITSAIEHPSVLEACRSFSSHVVNVTYLPSDHEGRVNPDDLRRAIVPQTRLISIMAANNVVGTLQPMLECGRIAHERGIPFHVDAVQAAGKVPLDMNAMHIDLLSLSGHKIYANKGIGALFVREETPLYPVVHGGGQEGGLRSGTENVAGIVALGAAARLCQEEMSDESARIARLRERLIEGVLAAVPESYLFGHRFQRLPGLACFGFSGLEGQSMKLLLALDDAGVAVSAGSACSAHHAGQPSHVLTAMGFDPIRARGSMRVSLGRFNDESHVDRFVEVLDAAVRQLTPLLARR